MREKSEFFQNNTGSRDLEKTFACRLKSPLYAASTGEAYCQTQKGIYYKGSAVPVSGNAADKVYFILENPKNSPVDLLMNKTVYANFSNAHLKIVTYLCTKAEGMLLPGRNIVNTNTHKCNNKPSGKIFSGKNLLLRENGSDCMFTVKPYDTFRAGSEGSILIAPGKCYIAEFSSMDSGNGFESACSFAWWEEAVCKN